MRTAMMALALLGLLAVSSQAAAAQERPIVEKDPAIALGFAFLCPGCGHLYSGETTKGAVIAGISIGAVVTGFAIQLSRTASPIADCFWTTSGTSCRQNAHFDLKPILVGGAIGLAGYVVGLIDAGPSARRMNDRNRASFGAIDVRPALAAEGSLRTEFGIRLSTYW